MHFLQKKKSLKDFIIDNFFVEKPWVIIHYDDKITSNDHARCASVDFVLARNGHPTAQKMYDSSLKPREVFRNFLLS